MSLLNRLLEQISGHSRSHRTRRRREWVSPFGIQAAQVQVLENRRLLSALTVTTAADSGAGSLRAEIAAAKSGDTINFASSLKGQTITLTSGELLINQGLTIQGPGAAQLTISGGHTSRVFDVTSSQPVVLSGMTISNGNGDHGGAIVNSGALTMSGCTISTSVGNVGGGIFNSGTLTLSLCNVASDSASYGGGIANTGSVTATGSTLGSNHSSQSGGGVYNTAGAATFVANGCTMFANGAAGLGGGIAEFGGTVTLTNCTIAGNSESLATTGAGGGGLFVHGSHASLTNCTVSLNRSVGHGGGIGVDSSGVVSLTNTIVAGNNVGQSPYGADIYGTISLAEYSLIGSGAGWTALGAFGDIVGTSGHVINAMLGPLQNNGGPTMTMALLAGSPAIGTANNSAAPATDQRGVTRRDIPGEQTDMGAYEV